MTRGQGGSAPSSGPTPADASDSSQGRRVPLSQFGLGFWQAWWTLAFCSDVLLGDASGALLGLPVQTFMVGITTLGYLAILVAGRHGRTLASGRRGRVLAGALCCLGSLGMALATHVLGLGGAPGRMVLVAGAALFSLGNALLIALWGELWGALASGRVGRCLYMSYAIAFALYFALSPLPLPVRVAVVAVLPVVSCVVLGLSQAEPRRTPREASAPEAVPTRSIARALVVAFLLNFVWGLGLPGLTLLEGTGASFGSVSLVVAFVLLICLLAYMSLARPAVEAFSLYAPVMTAFAAGIVLSLMLPASLAPLGNGVVVLGGSCLDMLIMLVATDVAFRMRRPAALVLSLALLVARVGSLAGRLAYDGLLASGAIPAREALLACVLLTVTCGFVLFTRATLEGMYRTSPAVRPVDDALDAACATFAREHGLTPRETEVLVCLARGRSAPNIAERLSIAPGTAKNHISSIYRKAGVGDRQSLLNLIERS